MGVKNIAKGLLKNNVIKNGLVQAGVAGIGLTFVVSAVISFFGVSSTASTSSGDWSSYVDLGDYIVKTDEPGAMPALTKSELKKAVDDCYSGNAHDNYIAELDSFISIQSKYKVNAAFAVCVAQTESTGGTGWDLISSSTYNWYSIQGSIGGGYVDRNGTSWNKYSSFSDANDGFGSLISNNYFTQDKITVDTVGTIYCNPPTEWSKSVKGLLDKMYAAVAPEGGTFTGSTYEFAEKKYTIFNQQDYNDNYASGTIATSGCGVTSISICVSAYKNGETPSSIAKKCSKYGYTTKGPYGGNNCVFNKYLNEYGLKSTCHEGFGNDALDIITKHLKSGKPVILNIRRHNEA